MKILLKIMLLAIAVTAVGVIWGGGLIPVSPWQPGQPKRMEVEAAIEGPAHDCKAKRLRGELAGFAESAKCLNPHIAEAFKTAGFPKPEKIDWLLEQRVKLAEMADRKEISEVEMHKLMREGMEQVVKAAEPEAQPHAPAE